MLRERLAPRVEDRGDPDRAAEVPRIAPEGEQRVGGRAEEQRVDHARIALRERVEVVRQGEDDVEVRDRQQVGLARREPPFLGERLALGTVAIATGVVGDAARRRSGHTSPDARRARRCGRSRSRAAPRCCTVASRCVRRYASPCARTMSASSSRGGATRPPCPRGTAHTAQACGGGANRSSRSSGESGADHRVLRQMQVARRRADVPVAEQALNGVEVDAGLEQMGREGVAQRVNAARAW